jgi:hypothetical protein
MLFGADITPGIVCPVLPLRLDRCAAPGGCLQADLLEMSYDSVGAANPGGNARLLALLRAVVPDPDEADAKFAAITGRDVLPQNLGNPGQVGASYLFTMDKEVQQAAELDIPSGVDDLTMGDRPEDHYSQADVETLVLKQERRGATGEWKTCGGCLESTSVSQNFHRGARSLVHFWRDGQLESASRGSLGMVHGQCVDPAFSNMDGADGRVQLIRVGCMKRSMSDGHFYVTDAAKAAGGLKRCDACQALLVPTHDRNYHYISGIAKRQKCPGPIQIELQQGPWCLDKSLLVHKEG